MLGEIIPIIDTMKANKKLKTKNNEANIQIPEKLKDIDIKYLEEDYKNTLETKNRFEDKAKTIIAALTIAITLILNLSKIIEAITAKYDMQIVNICIAVLAILAIVYMLIAGMMSIQVLIKENLLYSIPLEDRTKQDKKAIYIKTQLNINQNLIRNNIIFSAYRSIRNSVFCLVIIFILAILPMSDSEKIMQHDVMVQDDSISFGVGAVNWISENENVSFDKVIALYDKKVGDGSTKNIYDKENQIIVSIKKIDGIYIIDSIISDIEEVE